MGVVFVWVFGVAGDFVILVVLAADSVDRVVLWVVWIWNFGVVMGFWV